MRFKSKEIKSIKELQESVRFLGGSGKSGFTTFLMDNITSFCCLLMQRIPEYRSWEDLVRRINVKEPIPLFLEKSEEEKILKTLEEDYELELDEALLFFEVAVFRRMISMTINPFRSVLAAERSRPGLYVNP